MLGFAPLAGAPLADTGLPGISASLGLTADTATLGGTGTAAVAASLSATGGAATLGGTGTAAVAASLVLTAGNAALASAGTAAVAASLVLTAGNAALASAGTAAVAASLALTAGNAALASIAAMGFAAGLSAAGDAATIVSTATSAIAAGLTLGATGAVIAAAATTAITAVLSLAAQPAVLSGRLVRVPLAPPAFRTLSGCYVNRTIKRGQMYQPTPQWPFKQPDDVADYGYDATAELTNPATGMIDPIIGVTLAVQPSGPGELAASRLAVDTAGCVVSVWLASGVAGRHYLVNIEATTAGGRTYQWPIGLPMARWPLASPLPAPASSGYGALLSWP